MSRRGTGFFSAVFLIASLAVFAVGGSASPAGDKPHQAFAAPSAASGHCAIVGAISHRCLNFHSDSTWREGLSDYHGSKGG
jgi:hypothetical protein